MAKVYLVGAGPGDPELLTVRAMRIIQRADVVLHDALVSASILELIRPSAQVIDIGKRCGNKLLTQEEINSLLVHFSCQAETVVRLKGGDPSIFGRSSEEIEALDEAGVAFEIVPGITSALAAAAAAQLSLTDRRHASSVVFTTAHRALGAGGTAWNRLVTSGSTVVIYMPGQDYAEIAAQLIAAGLPPQTPCAVVSSACRTTQQLRRASLGGLGAGPALPAPALLIVGQCAGSLAHSQTSFAQWSASEAAICDRSKQ